MLNPVYEIRAFLTPAIGMSVSFSSVLVISRVWASLWLEFGLDQT